VEVVLAEVVLAEVGLVEVGLKKVGLAEPVLLQLLLVIESHIHPRDCIIQLRWPVVYPQLRQLPTPSLFALLLPSLLLGCSRPCSCSCFISCHTSFRARSSPRAVEVFCGDT
jgi:hypothetical protein